MKVKPGTLQFSTGREVRVNCGIVGIDDELSVTHGFDGIVGTPGDDHGENVPLTRQECVELADFMAVRWMRFRELHAKEIK